ncbi:MAG TPA: adenylate cyclase regulatory domain-containing protein [Solirubrobacteraceae bacterium]|nr:adenylate cyclase regulatory domain-containing protein [Solirubrobacteraceae bacterium]
MSAAGIDAEREGLLEGCEGEARQERLALLEFLFARGVTLEEAKRASRSDRLPMLATERALSGAPKYTVRDIAQASGVSVEFLLDARRAVGVARPDPDERVFGDDDMELGRILGRFLQAGFPEESLVRTIRVLGRGLSRGARSMRETLAEAILERDVGEHAIAIRAVNAAEEFLPMTAPLLHQILRTHLLEQVRQEQVTTAQLLSSKRLPGTRQVTVCFADFVGFTPLGERLATEDLERVAAQLEDLTAEVVEPPVQLVKTIGDAVMLVGLEPEATVATALELVAAAADHAEAGLPPLRAGLSCGAATNHSGDWYGHCVNVASRVTATAPAGTVVSTREVREAVADRYEWTALGGRRFKGIEDEIEVFEVRREGRHGG